MRKSGSASLLHCSAATTIPFDVTVIYSDRFLEHRKRGFHPEQPTRVSIPATELKAVNGVRVIKPSAEDNSKVFEETVEKISKVHTPQYIKVRPWALKVVTSFPL